MTQLAPRHLRLSAEENPTLHYSVIPAKAGTQSFGEKHAYILPQT